MECVLVGLRIERWSSVVVRGLSQEPNIQHCLETTSRIERKHVDGIGFDGVTEEKVDLVLGIAMTAFAFGPHFRTVKRFMAWTPFRATYMLLH
jgi:hypothetical protein